MYTPLKSNIEANNWWFVDVYPFSRVYFQVPCYFSRGVSRWDVSGDWYPTRLLLQCKPSQVSPPNVLEKFTHFLPWHQAIWWCPSFSWRYHLLHSIVYPSDRVCCVVLSQNSKNSFPFFSYIFKIPRLMTFGWMWCKISAIARMSLSLNQTGWWRCLRAQRFTYYYPILIKKDVTIFKVQY